MEANLVATGIENRIGTSNGNGSALVHQPQGSTTVSHAGAVYDRIEPLVFVERFGKVFHQTGAGGAKSQSEGELLALACLSRRMDVFELTETYDLISGKLAMKSVIMLAKFRKAGGRHRWINDGQDGQFAECEFEYEGQKTIVKYTIEDARRAEMSFKNSSNWVKTPGAMMRARVASTAIRMLAPELIQGSYCPEELGDGDVDARPIAAVAVSEEKPARKRRTAAEMAADDAAASAAEKTTSEKAKTGTATTSTITTPVNQTSSQSTLFPPVNTPVVTQPEAADSEVIDVPFTVTEPVATASASKPVEAVKETKTAAFNPDLPKSVTAETLNKIDACCVKLEATRQQVEEQLKNGDADFKDIVSLSENSAKLLLERLEKLASGEGE